MTLFPKWSLREIPVYIFFRYSFVLMKDGQNRFMIVAVDYNTKTIEINFQYNGTSKNAGHHNQNVQLLINEVQKFTLKVQNDGVQVVHLFSFFLNVLWILYSSLYNISDIMTYIDHMTANFRDFIIQHYLCLILSFCFVLSHIKYFKGRLFISGNHYLCSYFYFLN